MYRFIVPSLLGIIWFMLPIPYNNEMTILIVVVSGYLRQLLEAYFPVIITTIFIFSLACTLITKWMVVVRKKKFSPLIHDLFDVSLFWVVTRFIGASFALLTLYKVGTEKVWSINTGGLILNELLPILFSVFLFAGLFLPLLLNFGLLELCGVLLKKFMRPIFLLPGRSSVDCLTSWLGDGTIGVLLTSKQYEEGYYTQREAATIGTTFSVVSITFSLVVITQVKLEHLFIPFYLTVVLSGVMAAIICPRIPPLSRKPDSYYNNKKNSHSEDIPKGLTPLNWGIKQAVHRAQKSTFGDVFKGGVKNILDMWVGITPIVMAFGTLGLMLQNYTPVFEYLGMPFIPILHLLQIPEVVQTSQAIVAGFVDMFLPSVMISGVENEMTRFIVACVSVTQLIYMSEVGSILLASKIPISFKDICIIFLERTLITLPLIVLVAHFVI